MVCLRHLGLAGNINSPSSVLSPLAAGFDLGVVVNLPSLAERRAVTAPIIEKWRDHPLVQDRVRESSSAVATRTAIAPAVTTPAQVVGEMGIWAVALAAASENPSMVEAKGGEEHIAAGCARLAYLIDRATPYLWLNTILAEAMRSQVPRHIVSRNLLPTPICWFTRETSDEPLPGISRDGWILVDQGDALEVTDIGNRDEDRKLWIKRSIIKYGSRYPDDFGEQAHAVGQWLAAFAFLNSPYVGAERVRVSRPARRALTRYGSEDDPEVRFVALRSPVPESGERPLPTGKQTTYSRRWFVRGHIRAQWYPSEESHKLIWIAPYIKGPEDKPLLNTIYKVAR